MQRNEQALEYQSNQPLKIPTLLARLGKTSMKRPGYEMRPDTSEEIAKRSRAARDERADGEISCGWQCPTKPTK